MVIKQLLVILSNNFTFKSSYLWKYLAKVMTKKCLDKHTSTIYNIVIEYSAINAPHVCLKNT